MEDVSEHARAFIAPVDMIPPTNRIGHMKVQESPAPAMIVSSCFSIVADGDG